MHISINFDLIFYLFPITSIYPRITMNPKYILLLLVFFSKPFSALCQTIDKATDHLDNVEKIAFHATEAFFEYANARFGDRGEKLVARKKNQLLNALESQNKNLSNEKPFNGQMKLKTAYASFIEKLRQFPDNLGPYVECSIQDYHSGVAQERKRVFMKNLEGLKVAASDLDLEVQKYILINKLKDFRKGSKMPAIWNNAFVIFTYSQKIQESVLTIAAWEHYFMELVKTDSIDKAEKLQPEILQMTSSLGGAVKVKSPANTDDKLRESAVNSVNLYRMDAFRNFKSIIKTRKSENAFKIKYASLMYAKEKNEALLNKYEIDKTKLEPELQLVKNLEKEMRKEWERIEKAFSDNLSQFLDNWAVQK